jgi:tRNA A-37 threonylcarbamoyl transferase component Bud32
MEKRPTPGQDPPAGDDPLADTQAISHAALSDVTGPDAVPLSRREGARASVFASVSGEGEQGDVAASAPLSVVSEASRYERGPLLGTGGMGEVFLHLDRRIGRHVANKTLLREVRSDRTVALFAREARVQGQLEHPSVVPVYDFGVGPDGAPFFTMKRVRGETLAHILERLAERDADYTARFSRHKLLAAFRQVCLAVQYAHLRGVVHRDLKPGNIMLGDFGEVYVLDWGLAKLRSDVAAAIDGLTDATQRDADRTAAQDMVGTPAYMAPEQFGAGRHTFDLRQDVFALGAVLFEILTLTRYRPGASFATLLSTLLKEADRPLPTRPSEKAADVAPELDEACVRALSPEPTSRLDSAAAIADVVEQYLDGARDQGARKALADSLLASARARIAAGHEDASVRVDAMRDAIKALALVPDDVEAQRLLLSLVVDGSGKLPPEAERQFEQDDFDVDAHGLRMGVVGLGSWFLALPLAMSIGIRDWASVGVMALLTLVSMLYMMQVLRRRARSTIHVIALAALLGTTLSMTSRWLGPFVLVPVATCSIAMLFASRCKPTERLWLMVIWGLAVLAPFGVELLHIGPPAYSFRDGELVLHARALDLPKGLSLAALAYTSLTFMILPMILVGKLRDRQTDGDRRLFVQAWHLRQLFPAKGP